MFVDIFAGLEAWEMLRQCLVQYVDKRKMTEVCIQQSYLLLWDVLFAEFLASKNMLTGFLE